jgi:hypothetical protein
MFRLRIESQLVVSPQGHFLFIAAADVYGAQIQQYNFVRWSAAGGDDVHVPDRGPGVVS